MGRKERMIIGLISDTHMPSRAKRLPQAVYEAFQGVDLILHAGDWTAPEVVAMLEEIAPVDGVAGNNDGEDMVRRFGRQKLLQIGGFQIGIVHGDGIPKTTEQRAFEAFPAGVADIVLFGHSHTPYMEQRDGVWLFNPGSPTDKRWQPLYSCGLLTLTDKIELRHHFFASKL